MIIDVDGLTSSSGEVMMPFVVVDHAGGPYDARSFAAGYQVAAIACDLAAFASGPHEILAGSVYPETVPQLDLLAMHYHVRLRVEPCGTPGWVHVAFSRETATVVR